MKDKILDTQDQQKKPKKSPPIKIPLDFETAVEGLLMVNPEKGKKTKKRKGESDGSGENDSACGEKQA